MLLPQEIIDLIIDQVSAEGRASQLMKTCSLVSHSFHARARTHLFARIYLENRTSGYQTRARRFLSILKYKKNSELLSHIRSVKIFLRLHAQTYSQQQRSSRRLLKLVGIDTSPIKAVLALLKDASIEELILEGNSPCHFRNHRMTILLLELCSNPNIKTLCFHGIPNIPSRFIIGNGQDRSLTRLALRRSTISDYWFDIPPPTVVSIAAGLETLELVRMTSEEFWKVSHSICPRLPSPLSQSFKNLKNLAVTFPQGNGEERNQRWNFILGVAKTLESLELCLGYIYSRELSLHLRTGHGHPDNTSEWPPFDASPLRFDQLKSLRRLKIMSVDKCRTSSELSNELTFLATILASSASPLHVCSVILEISFAASSVSRYREVAMSSILEPYKWLPIDRVLASPRYFVDLRSVEVMVKGKLTIYDDVDFSSSNILLDSKEIDFAALLPTLSSHPQISLVKL